MIDFTILKYGRSLLESSRMLIEIIQQLVLLQPQGKKERFEQVIKPLHNHFEDVHRDYAEMLRNLKKSLPIKTNGHLYKVPGKKRHLGHDSALVKSRKLIEKFDEDRAVKIGLRDWLRNSAKGIVAELRNDKERRYFYSIFVYFLDAKFIENPTNEVIKFTISELSERGGDAVFSTPSSMVMMELDKIKTVDGMHEYLKNEIHSLGLRCSNVVRFYTALI